MYGQRLWSSFFLLWHWAVLNDAEGWCDSVNTIPCINVLWMKGSMVITHNGQALGTLYRQASFNPKEDWCWTMEQVSLGDSAGDEVSIAARFWKESWGTDFIRINKKDTVEFGLTARPLVCPLHSPAGSEEENSWYFWVYRSLWFNSIPHHWLSVVT